MATDVNWTTSDKWRLYNLDEVDFPGVGPYDVPIIQPEQYEPTNFIGFNFAKGCKDRKSHGVHFFLDDYQFARVWNQLKRYTEMLSEFNAVLSPMFSICTDWPKALQIWNMYRRHYVAAYMQSYGVKVYPTVMWSDESSFEWCFDGEPVHSCVAVGSLGTQKHEYSKKLFMKGYDAMLERLQPETILFYGKIPEGCRGNIVHIEPFHKRFDELRKGKING